MIQLDNKEKQMLKHYNRLFVEFLFDEYDILGFFMLIREHIRKGNPYPCILEFADMIAHRARDRGQVLDAITVAIDNNYKTYDGKRVVDYKGIDKTRWKSEWKNLLNELNISINKRLLDEITICIFSLANGSKYDDGVGHVGILFLTFSNKKASLMATEGMSDSLSVTFFEYSDLWFDNIDRKYVFGKCISETVRENGTLKMKDEFGDYIF